ncbi:MAG: DUF4157 domain-containing protein [Spirulina sp. SIO3F2]|nr:DUF4157 domain-containing protein [Spirulina sp. SIO3F2]
MGRRRRRYKDAPQNAKPSVQPKTEDAHYSRPFPQPESRQTQSDEQQALTQSAPATQYNALNLPVMPKLTIGAVGNKYEQEADMVAAQVVQQLDAPQPVQREEYEDEKSDIFFRQGVYAPESQNGQELLAHELTHTIQQQPTANTQAKQDNSNDGALNRTVGQGIIQKWDEEHKKNRAIANHRLACEDHGLYKIWYREGHQPTELIISSHGMYLEGCDDDFAYGANVTFYTDHNKTTGKDVNYVMKQKGEGGETVNSGWNYILSYYQYGGNNPDWIDSLLWLRETYGSIGHSLKKSDRRKDTYAVLTINPGKYVEYSKLREDGVLGRYARIHAAHCRAKDNSTTYDTVRNAGILN